jgi:hypothetical protein
MKALPIRWQRLVGPDGTTCDRCGGTYDQMNGAMEKLRLALAPLGLEPVLETLALDDATFKADPSQSNRIWIAGRPMEDWLEAGVGSSPCCSVCGDSPCRTVRVGGVTYETIPEDLILKAALRAASSAASGEVRA